MRAWLRIKGAASYAGVSTRTFRDWLKQGLKSYRVKGALLVHPDDIDVFIKSSPADGPDIDKIAEEVVEAMTGRSGR